MALTPTAVLVPQLRRLLHLRRASSAAFALTGRIRSMAALAGRRCVCRIFDPVS
jgi:hypothetical protein